MFRCPIISLRIQNELIARSEVDVPITIPRLRTICGPSAVISDVFEVRIGIVTHEEPFMEFTQMEFDFPVGYIDI